MSLMLHDLCARWHKHMCIRFPMQTSLCCRVLITILQHAKVSPKTIQLNDPDITLTTWCHVTGPGSSTSKKAVQLCHPNPKRPAKQPPQQSQWRPILTGCIHHHCFCQTVCQELSHKQREQSSSFDVCCGGTSQGFKEAA